MHPPASPPDRTPAGPGRSLPAAEARFTAALAQLRAASVEAARALLELHESGHWRAQGCASLGEYGELHGSTAQETRTLLALGQAITLRPGLRAEVLDGRISVGAAALLRDVLVDAGLERPGDRFVEMARQGPCARLARLIRRRKAEQREGGPVATVTVHLSGRGMDDLERCHALASRRAERMLSYGETVQETLAHYVKTFGPERRTPRGRRMPTTRGRAHRRVPAEVTRELLLRHDGRCAVPRCDHGVWLDRAHRHAKALGGDQEIGNLILLCRRHHRMLDSGELRIEGPPGRERFITRDGRDLGAVHRPP